MPDDATIPPIDPGELLYRRISEKDYDPLKSPYPEYLAFRPNEHDDDGISLFRQTFKTPVEVALGRAKPGKKYFVGAIRASTITALGLTVATDDCSSNDPACPPDPAHARIIELTAAVRREQKTASLAQTLARSCLEILGPFALPS